MATSTAPNAGSTTMQPKQRQVAPLAGPPAVTVPSDGPGAISLASLVKYDQPVLVGTKEKKRKRQQAPTGAPVPPQANSPSITATTAPGQTTGAKLPDISDLDQKNKDSIGQVADILNIILPKREFKEDTTTWEMCASTTPATRADVISLGKELHKRLQERRARETGICPIRRELYNQCFDELIRQVTMNCLERGILLTHVRNELAMTLSSYQTLYESSIAFGLRKALEAEQGKADLEAKIAALDTDKKSLERQVSELKTKCEFIEKRENERRAHEEKKHNDEVAFLRRTNLQLKTQLESILKKN